MVGRSKPISVRDAEASREKAALQKIAVERYQAELAKPILKDRRGVRKVCEEVEAEHKAKTGRNVKLNHNTINNHANGGRSIQEFNLEKRWLTPEEEETVLHALEESATQGFPLSHQRLKEHVDLILRARLGDAFPPFGVGKNWTLRFVQRHSNRVKTMWGSTLEGVRAQAVNPKTNEEWFNLLEEHIKDTPPECLWAADETGFQFIMATRERVFGKKSAKIQHQMRSGSKENVTVIVTICADGSYIPPAVIYKGKGYLPNWEQENPLKAL
jgi:hypothetical protein